jgi:isochorismate synthase
MVATALESLADGEIDKVVVARAVDVVTEHPIAPGALLRRLATREPDRHLFADATIVGASPELLVRRQGPLVRARPLAGSAPVGPAVTGRLVTDKNRREHRFVAEFVRRTLAEVAEGVTADPPRCVRLADVAHLATDIRGRVTPTTPSALGLARRLHPTPAVGGVPTAAALATIGRVEGDRGGYAGPVGWVDGRGDGEFAVALRCAELDPDDACRAVVRAGAGIVAGSDADDEWDEIDAKLRPVLAAFGR